MEPQAVKGGNVELNDYLRLLGRRWWLLLLCMVLGGVGGFAASQQQERVFSSTATLFLSDGSGRPVNTLIATNAQGRFASYSALIHSAPVTTEAVQSPQIRFPFTISAVGIPDTIFLRVTATASSPERAYEVARVYTHVFPNYVGRFEQGATGTAATSLAVLDPPRINPALISPDERRNEVVGVGLGLVVALGMLVLLEALDNKIRDAAEVEPLTGVGVAAAVPTEFKGEQLVTARRPRSQRAEAMRLVRTNVQFAGVGSALRTLVVTSPGAGEGKTSVATDLAIACAQAGQRVVLVDGDLRKPRLAEIFELPGEPGLTNVLVGDAPLQQASIRWGEGDLRILTCGTRPAKPSELLGSAKMGDLLNTLQADADLVIVDSAPVLPVADTTALLAHADAVLLVIKVGATTRGRTRATLSRLESVNARVIGIVANGAQAERGDGYYSDSKRRRVLGKQKRERLLEIPTGMISPELAAGVSGTGRDSASSQVALTPDEPGATTASGANPWAPSAGSGGGRSSTRPERHR